MAHLKRCTRRERSDLRFGLCVLGGRGFVLIRLSRTYQRGVSFDTFDNRDATDFSLTLNYKHKDFQYTRRSRTFLCGTDDKDYSEFALEWLIDELLDDGDEIVCLVANGLC